MNVLSSSQIVCAAILAALVIAAGCEGGGPDPDDPIEKVRRQIQELQARGVPEGHVRVTVTRLEVSDKDRTLLKGLARYEDKNVRISTGHLGGKNGLRIYGTRGDVFAGMAASHRSWRESIQSQQFLTVLPNTTATISAIEQQTRGWLVVIPIWRGEIVINTLREEVTGTGMEFHVTDVTRDSAVVILTPFFHRTRRGKRLLVTELRTTLRLRPGVPYVFASQNTKQNSFAQGFLSYSRDRGQRQVAHVIKLEVGKGERK